MNHLEWKRAKTIITDDFRRRIWESKGGRFRVEESVFLLVADFPVAYLAIERRGEGSVIIGRHRVKSAAVKTCERAGHKAVARG